MNPFQILGIPDNSPVAVAKKAWQKAARLHHPDMGGAEEKFKVAKAAWESIEAGFVVMQFEKVASSFGPPPTTFTQRPARVYPKKAGPVLPRTVLSSGYTYKVTLKVKREHADSGSGCVIPFIHSDEVVHYYLQPGLRSRIDTMSVPHSQIIGKDFGRKDTIEITLEIA